MTYISLYSWLPHKELRFVFPAIPLINVAASVGFVRLRQWSLKQKLFHYLSWMGYVAIIGSMCISMALLYVSSHNYPGGVALQTLHNLPQSASCSSTNSCTVHIGNLAATTGVSRFGQRKEGFIYDKTEALSNDELTQRRYDFLINEQAHVDGYTLIMSIDGFAGLQRNRQAFPFVSIRLQPQCYLHRLTT